jgi:hypothetical protein
LHTIFAFLLIRKKERWGIEETNKETGTDRHADRNVFFSPLPRQGHNGKEIVKVNLRKKKNIKKGEKHQDTLAR